MATMSTPSDPAQQASPSQTLHTPTQVDDSKSADRQCTNSVSPTSTAQPTTETATSYLTSLLDRPLRVTLKDSRTVIGRLHVIDGGGNMILSEAEEFPASLAELFDVNREQSKEELNDDEAEDLYWRSESIREEITDRWEKGEKWLPRSEPFGGPGTGWGGRGLGLVLAKLEDCTRIELLDEEDSEARNGNEGHQAEDQKMG